MKRKRCIWRYGALAAIAGAACLGRGLLVSEAAPAPVAEKSTAGVTAPSGLSPEAARMYVAVRKPRPGELGWQQIPWGTDLQNAARVARTEKRPLLIFVSGDDPLEKC